jgi:nucleoside phosphorylase
MTVQSTRTDMPSSQPACVLIITATKVETQAVLATFSDAAGKPWTRQPIGNKVYYNLHVHGGVPISMVQSEKGTATPGGALLTVRQAIDDLHPQAVIMCGIAYGLHPEKQNLGDILVAQQIEYFEPQKMNVEGRHMPRGDRATSADRLLARFRSGDVDWQGATTHFGLILSGEKLVNDPAFRNQLLETEPEAVGGDMESAGLYAAARDARVDWILVKAICDWADGKKSDDAQQLAAHNAAEYVLHVIKMGGWEKPDQLPTNQSQVYLVGYPPQMELEANLGHPFYEVVFCGSMIEALTVIKQAHDRILAGDYTSRVVVLPDEHRPRLHFCEVGTWEDGKPDYQGPVIGCYGTIEVVPSPGNQAKVYVYVHYFFGQKMKDWMITHWNKIRSVLEKDGWKFLA